ncbi:MAG TPA: DUF3718 domain-containing protein [Rheinheimera sp.]|nr:DUF3718 domain-containing protein [Rheinheimera sp.]
MKKLMLVAVSLATASMALVVSAGENTFNRYTENALIQVCSETADDDRIGLTKTLKAYRISKQTAVEKVVCNGQELIDFARANQAVNVTAMLKPYEERTKGTVTIKDVAAAAPN